MKSITAGLLDIKGVTAVAIDKTAEKLFIETTTGIAPLLQKLTQMGYPPKGENTLLKKAKSYVSCAMGNLKS